MDVTYVRVSWNVDGDFKKNHVLYFSLCHFRD